MIDTQILIISDEPESARLWVRGLAHLSIPAATVKMGTNLIENFIPGTCNLIALDINRKCQVFSICRSARASFQGPILLCTYERDERFHLRAYETGIEESISKPIGIRLFRAKALAWLRRATGVPLQRCDLWASDFQLDTPRRTLTTPDGLTARLSVLEFRLLMLLINNRGCVVEPDAIRKHVWTNSREVGLSLTKDLVYRLRQKIERNPNKPQFIETVARRGYRFRSSEPQMDRP